ncbi:flagellar M-ring protein FliF C-terminal domain-containing protein [Candidatus Accumulibacter necessarius]|uniref:flagellar M-ring protein FliF C-terminal domain-containing protein n=1 Tax=Candidatus Accumulibacter necessarius TaxID=2954386 RepID=UPI003DA8982E
MKSRLLEAGLDPTQVKYIQEVEASIIKRVEDILAPIVGPGNARVQIAADIDFSQSEQTAETHRPNTTPPEISIRSQQTSETASTSPTAQGVPGALSNQPPVPATAPLTQPAVASRGRRRAQRPSRCPGRSMPPACRHRSPASANRSAPARTRRSTTRSTRPSATSSNRSARSSACRRRWWSISARKSARTASPSASRCRTPS